MKRCFELAALGGRETRSNPNVGSLLVYQNRIIGEGYHKRQGEAHAEINALADVDSEDKQFVKDATLYVSLEPCNIHSLTPPCSDAIIQAGIKRVVISAQDPNPKVAGKSIEQLRAKGIDVITDVCLQLGMDLIKPFKVHLQQRPYVILKWAQSSDAYIGKRDQLIQISGPETSLLTHKWRSEIDGILVGHNTVITDDPQLTTRLVDGSNPLRIILTNDPSELSSKKVATDGNPSLFVGSHNLKESEKEVLYMDQNLNGDNLIYLLKALFQKGIFYLMVEGGGKTLKMFIDQGLWDEARIIKSNQSLISGIRAPQVTGRRFSTIEIGKDSIDYVYPDMKC